MLRLEIKLFGFLAIFSIAMIALDWTGALSNLLPISLIAALGAVSALALTYLLGIGKCWGVPIPMDELPSGRYRILNFVSFRPGAPPGLAVVMREDFEARWKDKVWMVNKFPPVYLSNKEISGFAREGRMTKPLDEDELTRCY